MASAQRFEYGEPPGFDQESAGDNAEEWLIRVSRGARARANLAM